MATNIVSGVVGLFLLVFSIIYIACMFFNKEKK